MLKDSYEYTLFSDFCCVTSLISSNTDGIKMCVLLHHTTIATVMFRIDLNCQKRLGHF